ncbi:hypothetical protein HYU06_01550 [Candidatus Woesearchaeota archaeon]|nr:hypothetical protein [Candidatus Woesearchaeota archaeon]
MKREEIIKLLEKSKQYKYHAWKIKFQKKHFGIADNDLLTFDGLVELILRLTN